MPERETERERERERVRERAREREREREPSLYVTGHLVAVKHMSSQFSLAKSLKVVTGHA